MTQKLYEDDAYMQAFSALVRSCARAGERWHVTLDRTAFYPEGGGQPGDGGTLDAVRVLDTRFDGDEIIHICDGPLEPNHRVDGRIDWDRRFDHMQQHSGEHLVSGLICSRYSCDNVGFHLGKELVVIDFNTRLDSGDLADVERGANAVIWENRPFLIHYPEASALAHLRYRSKKELTGPVRLVECPGADLCACCGTHVRFAGELGLIRLLSVRP